MYPQVLFYGMQTQIDVIEATSPLIFNQRHKRCLSHQKQKIVVLLKGFSHAATSGYETLSICVIWQLLLIVNAFHRIAKNCLSYVTKRNDGDIYILTCVFHVHRVESRQGLTTDCDITKRGGVTHTLCHLLSQELIMTTWSSLLIAALGEMIAQSACYRGL